MSQMTGTLYAGKERRVVGSVVLNDDGKLVFTKGARYLEKTRPEGYTPATPRAFMLALARVNRNAPYLWFQLHDRPVDQSRMTMSPGGA